jgi:DNA-binding NarL/FixJ family response regulator
MHSPYIVRSDSAKKVRRAAGFPLAPHPVGSGEKPVRRDHARAYPQSSWWCEHVESVLLSYAALRGFSDQQFAILNFYLEGKSDKEIAKVCQCSCATVYEHWSRMAKKSGRSRKSDVIADFHRFLRGG